jgi:hypothetical protein
MNMTVKDVNRRNALKGHFLSASIGFVFAHQFNKAVSAYSGVSTASLSAIHDLYAQASMPESVIGSVTLTASLAIWAASWSGCKHYLAQGRSPTMM